MSTSAPVLLAEDDEADVYLLQRAFEEAGIRNPVHVARDGQECIDLLDALRNHPESERRVPSLLVLDLKMPQRSGMDVLRWLRAQPILRSLPTVVFSSSANQRDIEQAYLLGANAFVVKPASVEQRTAFARLIKEFWLGFNQPPLMCTEGYRLAQKLHATTSFEQSVL